MCGAHGAWQARLFVNIDSSHQIQSQQRQVGQVVARQILSAQMRVNTAQAAKAIAGHANSLEVGKFDPARVADDHELHVTLAVNQRANLPSCFVGKFAELSRKFRSDDLVRRNATLIEFFNPPQLIWL
jgi:hypothetical protein